MTGKRKEELTSLAVIAIGLGVMGYFSGKYLLFLPALVILGLGLISPVAASRIHGYWMKLSKVLGFFSSWIILSLVFYLILFPLSLLSSLFNKKDSLMLSGKGDSTFISRNKTFVKIDLEKPW